MYQRALMVAAAFALAPWMIAGSAGQEAMSEADLDDFQLDTAQQLADLCSAEQGDPLHAEGRMFCYGVLEGIAQYHDAMARGPEGERIVCPQTIPTREQYVQMFLDWVKANPDMASDTPPADSVIAAALEEWGPCEE
jgi:Rap1a immunity proteins